MKSFSFIIVLCFFIRTSNPKVKKEKMKLKPEDQLILLCIKIAPTPVELEQINALIPQVQDWVYLVTTIIDRGIGPLLFKKLPLLANSSLIPENVSTNLRQAYYKTFSRSTLLYEHFRKIVLEFTSQDIPVIGLKGIYLSELLYQDIGLRQFSDIDLLVKAEDGEKCLGILEGMGYIQHETHKISEFVESQFDLVHYPALVLNGVSVEIHIRLHQNTESYSILIPELWNNSVPVTVNGVQISTLAINDLLVYLCLHLDKHFRSGHIQFTCFNDITNLLEKYSETIDWNHFIKTCKLYKCEEIVFKYFVLVNTYMNAFLPTQIIKKYNSILTESDEQLFYNYLKGNFEINGYFLSHLNALKKIQDFSGKVHYLKDILFPTKAFMISTYKIKKKKCVIFYYPYRYLVGIRGVIGHFRSRIEF